jgi:hypothetical protein
MDPVKFGPVTKMGWWDHDWGVPEVSTGLFSDRPTLSHADRRQQYLDLVKGHGNESACLS